MLVVSKNEQSGGPTNSDSYEKSQLFTLKLDKIIEIAKIITQLAESDHQGYLKYLINLTEAETRLEEIHSKLNSILQVWRNIIEEARNSHYYLNYYTISQIALLQKGIKSVIEGRKDSDREQLYHLLRLLNNEITKKDVQQALRKSDIISEYLNQSSCSESNTTLSTKEMQLAEVVRRETGITMDDIKAVILELKEYQSSYVISQKSIIYWCKRRLAHATESCECKELPDTGSVFLPIEISLTKGVPIEPHLDINKLGDFLKEIHNSCTSKITGERTLPYDLIYGTPNLVVMPSSEILEFLLSLYLSDNDKFPLPFYHEVLFCTDQTTNENVEIFFRRVLDQEESVSYLFCMINIENLKYEVAVETFSNFKNISQEYENRENEKPGKSRYKLVLICSEEKEGFSYLATAFEDYKRSILVHNEQEELKRHLNKRISPVYRRAIYKNRQSAWVIDKEKSKVRIVASNSSGAGKSLYIQNLRSDMLSQGVVREDEIEQAVVTVAIHGNQASEDYLVDQLLSRNVSIVKHGVMFHLDIASTVQLGLESILFKLLILGGVCNRSGMLWHSRHKDYYVIEITLSSDQNQFSKFTSLFPVVRCIQPTDALEATADINTHTVHLLTLRNDQYQRVDAYLKTLDIGQNLDSFVFKKTRKFKFDHIERLNRTLENCGIAQPSWAEVRNFTNFLDKQLLDCDKSVYCKSKIMGQEWNGFKSFVVKFMLNMSKDFATPALGSCSELARNNLAKFEILDERRWENNSHPYIFFNPDGHTMTFLGFNISKQGHLLDSDNPSKIIKENIMDPQLYTTLNANRVLLQEDYNLLSKVEKIAKIAGVMGIDFGLNPIDPDPCYVLTPDNIRKILAILMRFRCNIPVVIMGETGCGKTRLIQFMCSLQALQTGATNMLILKVHGGTTEKDVKTKVEEAEVLAMKNFRDHDIDTVLFFDEANTSPAIGLIKEIMCDRRMYGRHISSDIRLQFIAACNPYRRHTKEMLNKLSTAGLGFFTKASETTDRLGDIPLRELVYRVIELPASMLPLVWDFGKLSNDVEKAYTREIVAKHLRDRNSPIQARDKIIVVISNVLAGAQNYMRERKDECSFVSLRDVERAMRVMLWFYKILDYFQPHNTSSHHEQLSLVNLDDDVINLNEMLFIQGLLNVGDFLPKSIRVSKSDTHIKSINQIDYITYSLILSLAVCYRAKLQERDDFDINIVRRFQHPLTTIRDHKVIHNEVDRCQQLILDEMTVGANIAKNNALKENVFMMFVCIELKIPLFVIGKPGSSKSLAKSIISNSMQGRRCPDGSILQNFKQIQIMSYQCSQLSTADGIIGVFNNCRNLQNKTGSDAFTACVVLEEVGLAEDSPLLPLKVLHPLLEDSNYGSEEVETGIGQTKRSGRDDPDDEMKNRVAFIGISNWALDPAKMNRGLMLSRGDPDLNELIISAKGICESVGVHPEIHKSISEKIPSLAKAYHYLTSNQVKRQDKEERTDYFGLRDFYSLIKMLVFICNDKDSNLNRAILEHAVKRNFGGISGVDPVSVFNELVELPKDSKKVLDSSPLGLITANLTNLSRSFHGETRYLLLFTENYAALTILLRSPEMWPKHQDVNTRVIFGSSFPCDQEYSAVCLNINRIKMYMESGKTIILLNLENLYESLYDALNQYYMVLNNQRYVDLGLGTHRMKCRIHQDFKLIVVADKETVQERFPTPLINRLEKHFLTMSTVLSKDTDNVKISEQLTEWAKNFSTIDNDHSRLEERDCFIGYQSDTPSCIVFHVIKEYENGTALDGQYHCRSVLERSQTLFLKMATTDAVLRVKNSLLSEKSDELIDEYFKLGLGSLEEYLLKVMDDKCNNTLGAHLTLTTTHSRIMTDKDVDELNRRLYSSANTNTIEITNLSLHQFQTEQQYSREIQKFLRGRGLVMKGDCYKKILLVQCERGADNAKLITCARLKTVDELKDWIERDGECQDEIFIVFLILLKRETHGSKFASFCGGDWNTVHIDDIHSLDYTELPLISLLYGKPNWQLFDEYDKITPQHISHNRRFNDCIQQAASRLDDIHSSGMRTVERIRDLNILLTKDKYRIEFIKTLCQRLTNLLRDQSNSSIDTNTNWLQQTANCVEDIQSSGTFRKAVNLRINSAITPLIAELIACIDRNGNLELALYNEKVPECLFNLWYDIFRDERLLMLQYKDTISPNTLLPRRRVPVLSDGGGGEYFKAQFPFSWLINQRLAQLSSETKILSVDHSDDFCRRLEVVFVKTPLGEKIMKYIMEKDESLQLVQLYLHDFIYMNLFPIDNNKYQVYKTVLQNYINTSLPDEDEEQRDIMTIPRIHCAFENSKQLLELFQQAFQLDNGLAGQFNKIISKLEKVDDEKMNCLELVLIEVIINLCGHKKERTASKKLAEQYVSEVNQWQAIVEKGLSFNQNSSDENEKFKLELRCRWTRIIAVQLFIGNCALGVWYSEIESKIHKLFTLLGETPDFTSVELIKEVIQILTNCMKKMKKGSGLTALDIQEFQIKATRFFISILTNLTFKSIRLEDRNNELNNLIMGFVKSNEKNVGKMFSDKGQIIIFTKDGVDPSPTFRAYLLQMLIRYRQDVFKDYISDYLTNVVNNLKNNLMKSELYLLISQSIEDSLHQLIKSGKPDQETEFVKFHINNVTRDQPDISYQLLEKIARLRFISVYISKWVVECYNLLKTQSNTQLPDHILGERMRLITSFQEICLMKGHEDIHSLLFKSIYHKLGSDTLNRLKSNISCSWIIPECVSDNIEIPDYFLIYKAEYTIMKIAIEQIIRIQTKEPLLRLFNPGNKPEPAEYFIYCLFQLIVSSIQQNGEPQIFTIEKFDSLKDFVNSDLKKINPVLYNLAIQIATNNFGNGNLPNLKLTDTSSNHELFLIRLIYHVAVMLSCKKYHKLFLPIALIYEDPQTLQDKLFPTMMDDPLISAKVAMIGESGKWYQCPKGHPYFIGNCGGAVTTYVCADCGCKIGGTDYKLKRRNVLLDQTKDGTKTGYLLGPVNHVRGLQTSDRLLSLASVKIIRILMDITFIWAAGSSAKNRNRILLSLMKEGLNNSKDIPNFFTEHLERDLTDLSGLTGKSFEEIVFFLHLITKSIMENARELCTIPTELTQKELREQWEREFNNKFIQPILNSLNTDVQRQMEQVLSEKRIANNPFLRMVYEKDDSEPNNPLPHLWRYRTIVSLEHFSQSFSTADLNTKNKCPLVDKFLKEENKLFVTRYLPDIVQLQRRVGDKFLHRLDRREAANTSIKDFLNRMKTENKQESEELARLVESLATAWSMIGEDVKKNGRLTMEESLEQQEITPATSLAYLLPSSTGEGVLITSLTDYLLLIHNSFVHAYRDRVKWSRSDKIPLRELNMSHVIEYEEHLQPLLLSHAHYSLALGQGSQVTYDFEGVEQQLMEQFIQNKPLILAEHSRFEYIREAYNLEVFEQVRHKVQQTEVRVIVWKAIQEDLDSLEAVSDVLLILDVVIRFLSSAGGDPEQKLSSYLTDVYSILMILMELANVELCLKHVISFRTHLSIEKARKLSLQGQIPFSSLKNEFQEVVSEEERKLIQESCKHFPVDKIMAYLHEYIIFFLQDRDSEEKAYGLRECVEIYANENDWELPEGFNQFPQQIQQSQCASAWAVLALQENTNLNINK
ncbi:E3 ubiquitin-protein ligase [Oopsacas minuta]|uniref:E3 ubiquitin-protein ligase n=1 Tax=Oopsacas minuta TaxID=111878 RepID=A0AAV7JEA8_9METZ|nr:E3 ubiquitin-protein ligase [Oopsacas minuta]